MPCASGMRAGGRARPRRRTAAPRAGSPSMRRQRILGRWPQPRPPRFPTAPRGGSSADAAHRAAPRGAGSRPGDTSFSAARTHRMATDPLPVLLSCYERYGPVFSVRILHGTQVFLLGPRGQPSRAGVQRSQLPLARGGLRRARARCLATGCSPSTAPTTAARGGSCCPPSTTSRWRPPRTRCGRRPSAPWSRGAPAQVVDVYAWARELAMRIAMRALLGLDPDDRGTGALAAREFERALSFYGTEYALRILRGPGSPWWRLQRARAVLDRIIFGEIERRRRAGTGHEDMLGMLMAATDEDGSRLSDREVRDQAVTLLFAGHDTSTSTISFMLYELARNPVELAALLAEQDEVLGRPAVRGGPGRRHAAPGHGARRDPAPLPARVDRAAAGRRGLRCGGRAGARWQLRELLLVGEPPAARRVPRAGGLRIRAVRARGQGRAAQGRLRALRRRLADVHRHALRADGGQGGGHAPSCGASAWSCLPGGR